MRPTRSLTTSANRSTTSSPSPRKATSPATKPLFIPLKTEFFEAFARGDKDTEYRLRGPRWNADTCPVGRRVILSKGYSGSRLHGVIVGFHYDMAPQHRPGWLECYGHHAGDAACIRIRIER